MYLHILFNAGDESTIFLWHFTKVKVQVALPVEESEDEVLYSDEEDHTDNATERQRE